MVAVIHGYSPSSASTRKREIHRFLEYPGLPFPGTVPVPAANMVVRHHRSFYYHEFSQEVPTISETQIDRIQDSLDGKVWLISFRLRSTALVLIVGNDRRRGGGGES